MQFNFLSPQQQPLPPTPSITSNQEAFDMQALPLCSKRKAIEWNLNNRGQDTRQVYEEELRKIKEEMGVHGVTEEYYQAHFKTLFH